MFFSFFPSLLLVVTILMPFVVDQVQAADKKKHQVFQDEQKGKKVDENWGMYKYVCDKGFCGCLKRDKENGITDLPKNFVYPTANINCPNQFYDVALMSMCGNEWFDQMKYCALVHFFDDDKNTGKMKSEENKNKRTLILIDGCVLPENEKCTLTGIRVTHFEKGGGFFSGCDENEEYEAFAVSGLQLEMPSGVLNYQTGAFTVPVVLYHRVCKGLLSDDEVDNQYTNLKLHLQFNECGTTTIDLPPIDLGSGVFAGENVGEIRGLQVKQQGGTFEISQNVRVSGGGEVSYTNNGPNVLEWADADVDKWVLKP